MYKRLLNISFIKSEFANGGDIPSNEEIENLDFNTKGKEELKFIFTRYLENLDKNNTQDGILNDNDDNLIDIQRRNIDKILKYISDRQKTETSKKRVLEEFKIDTGIDLAGLSTYIEHMKITQETIENKNVLRKDVDENIELEKLVKSTIVKPEKGELKLYKENGKYKLELDDYFLASTDPVYTFGPDLPSKPEIEEVVRNFNNSIELDGWENLPEKKQDKSPSKKRKEVKTKEVFTSDTVESHGFASKIERNDYTKNESLLKLLKRKDLQKIFKEMQNALKDCFEKDENGKMNLNLNANFGRNYTKLSGDDINTILDHYEYETDGFLDPEELMTIYTAIESKLATQNKIKEDPKISDRDKIRLLLDFNKDGVLDIKKRADVGEAHMENLTFEGLLSQGVDVLVKNLGFESKEELFRLMSEDLTTTRERFQNALLSAIERKTMPEELLMKDGLNRSAQRALKENKNLEERKREIVGLFIKDKFKVSSLEQLSKEQRSLTEKFMDAITPQSLGLGVANDRFGGSVSWDTQDPTSLKGIPVLEEMGSLFDTLTVGLSENGAGVILSKGLFKEFLDKYGINLTLSLVNLTIGSLTGSVRLNEAKLNEMKELFQETTKTKVEFRVVGGITSGLIITGGLQANFKNEDTIAGIEEMSDQLYKELEKAGKDILFGNKNSSFFKNPQDQKAYTQLKNIFDRATDGLSNEEKEKYMPLFIEGYVSNYRNKLNSNASGLTLSSVGIGVLLVPGFFPIPYITAGGELKWQEIDLVKGEDVKSDSVNYENIGGKLDEIHGFNALSFPKEEIHKLSVRDTKAQIEEYNGRMYISGVDPKTIKLKQINKNDSIKNILTVGNGEKETSHYKKYVSENLKLETTPGKEEGILNTGYDKPELYDTLIEIGAKFDNKTRNQSGALEFGDPTKTLEERWEGLKKLSKSKGLKDTELGNIILNAENSKNNIYDKSFIINHLSQDFRKSLTAYNGDIEHYNDSKKLEKLIAKEQRRRGKYDNILTTSLNEEVNQYYDKLKENEGNLNSQIINGIAFDAVSTINVGSKGKRVSGIDVLSGNISIITDGNGEPILIPINDEAKINTFKENINNLENIAPAFKQYVTDGLDNGTIGLSFFKDSQGFDDKIIIIEKGVDGKTMPLKIGGSSQSYIGAQENNVLNLGAVVTDKWERREQQKIILQKPTEPTEPTQPTEPTEPTEPTQPTQPLDTPPPETTPGHQPDSPTTPGFTPDKPTPVVVDNTPKTPITTIDTRNSISSTTNTPVVQVITTEPPVTPVVKTTTR